MNRPIVIATRQSKMALWQANFVRDRLLAYHPDWDVSLLGMTTQGDTDTTRPLTDIGGKTVFVKELQTALLDGRADIAVHCIKDLSVHAVDGLRLVCCLKRDDPRDVLINEHGWGLADLPAKAIVGTASPRRQSFLLAARPDVSVVSIRGNVNTRMAKLQQGDYDAIVLAAAGCERLGLTRNIQEYFDPLTFVPAIGQGALGIECRADDSAMADLLAPLNHADTFHCVQAEQAVNRVLGGDCHTPIGAYAKADASSLTLHARVGSLDGRQQVAASQDGRIDQARQLGHQLAHTLLDSGARSLLSADK